MVKLFAVAPDVEIRVGNYGTAKGESFVLVSEEVAAELADVPSVRFEPETNPAVPETKSPVGDTSAPKSDTTAPKTETKPAKGEKE